ncbi:hypothetical protein CSIM01_00630 [Colletotrichum simmondsii]|uniref:Uncharacterized protein n=1 Tax=Colletotrichum simmondsii TaxID=703756 RepID=A0A135SJ72_9PEZI|nr:hypothetical protein CSIM01_00630 [Colletotrichum simmondsii]
MRGHSILLALAGTQLSPTTADPIALAIVMPTESASLPLNKLKTPLGEQQSGVPATRKVISEGTGKETCPAEPICSGKTENGERTLCWYVEILHHLATSFPDSIAVPSPHTNTISSLKATQKVPSAAPSSAAPAKARERA